MFEILLYSLLFFGVPAILIVGFGISIYRYITAKKQNEESPGTFTYEEMKKRKTVLITLSAIVGVLVAVVVGFVALLAMAIAFM